MARWLITFGILVVLGSLLWPWLRQLGLARLPGDMAVDFIPGISFYLPIDGAADQRRDLRRVGPAQPLMPHIARRRIRDAGRST